LGQRGYILNLCERFSGFLSDRTEAYPHDSDTLAVSQDSRRAGPLSASMAKAYLTLVGSLGCPLRAGATTPSCQEPRAGLGGPDAPRRAAYTAASEGGGRSHRSQRAGPGHRKPRRGQ
jgi:hypothetical protein